MPRKKGKWFEGDIFRMSSDEMKRKRKYEEGVLKPTALETKKKGKKTYSRYYHKPLERGEFWD